MYLKLYIFLSWENDDDDNDDYYYVIKIDHYDLNAPVVLCGSEKTLFIWNAKMD